MWLLRFQMCAVVNRVALPHLCLRHHHGKSRMPRVVTITDGAKSVGDNITHQFTHPPGAITIAVQFASKRGIAKTRCCSPTSASLPQIRNAAGRHNHRRAKSFGGNFTHSLPPAPPRSPFNSHRNATSPKRYKGNRANSAQRECLFQIREHPMLPQQQPV